MHVPSILMLAILSDTFPGADEPAMEGFRRPHAYLAASSEVVQQTARRTIGRVHATQETYNMKHPVCKVYLIYMYTEETTCKASSSNSYQRNNVSSRRAILPLTYRRRARDSPVTAGKHVTIPLPQEST